MTPRSIKLLIFMGVLAIGWLAWWLFQPTPNLVVDVVRIPGQPVIFALNGRWVLDELVVRPDNGDSGATPTWHLKRNEERERADVPHPAVTYGRPPGGMDSADDAVPRRGKPLEPKKPYLVTVSARGTQVTVPFTAP